MESTDRDRLRLNRTQIIEIKDIIQLLAFIEQRNYYVKNKLPYLTDGLGAGEDFHLDMIAYCNDCIEKLLNLK